MGTTDRKKREKEARRLAIQECAKQVLHEKNFSSATIEEIAAKAELSIGTIYLYFSGKEDLFVSLPLLGLEQLIQSITSIVEEEDRSPEEILRKIWDTFYRSYRSDPINFRILMMFRQGELIKSLSEEIIEKLNSRGSSLLKMLANVFQRGIQNGIFMEENPRTLADVFWSTFVGIIHFEETKNRFNPKKDFFDVTLNLALEIFLGGLKRNTAK
jgi:TetR/AcrR family transcriptional regulator